MKMYVTFGRIHRHVINGVVYDKDCVAVIEAEDHEKGRDKAFNLFDGAFCFAYSEYEFNKSEQLKYCSRGLIKVE